MYSEVLLKIHILKLPLISCLLNCRIAVRPGSQKPLINQNYLNFDISHHSPHVALQVFVFTILFSKLTTNS